MICNTREPLARAPLASSFGFVCVSLAIDSEVEQIQKFGENYANQLKKTLGHLTWAFGQLT
jgi:hypothetical protein